jgi:hypothetical protein
MVANIKQNLYQNLLGLFIILMVGLALWPLSPKPNPEPGGIFLPSNTLAPPISLDSVQILEVAPPHAKILGAINTKLYFNSLSIDQERADLAKSLSAAKALAAANGANGVVPVEIGTTGKVSATDGFIIRALAISY